MKNSQERDRESIKNRKTIKEGKKKSHTFKNQIIVLPDGQDLVDVIAGKPGPKSDITLFRQSQKNFDPNQKFQGDKGYIGEPSIKTPTKKPKKGELSPSQIETNKKMASDRIFVEHLIRLLKIFRVASGASHFCEYVKKGLK